MANQNEPGGWPKREYWNSNSQSHSWSHAHVTAVFIIAELCRNREIITK